MTGRDYLAGIRSPTDHLEVDEAGVLSIEGCSAPELVRDYGSPLYVISEATLRENYRRIYRAFQNVWPAPINVLYAIKANNNFAVRAILHQEGAGGDCFGNGELYATFMGGGDPEKIVLNGSNKDLDHLRLGVRLGVRINVDLEEEIDLLGKVTADEVRPARVKLRVKIHPPEFDEYTSY